MPSAIRSFLENSEILRARLEPVRDGVVDAIHDARVATRRLRAALPVLLPADASSRAEMGAVVKRIGRVLGDARDLDVALELLAELERRSPSAAAAAATVRAHMWPEHLRRRRRLIKELERLDLAMVGSFAQQLHRRFGNRDVSRVPHTMAVALTEAVNANAIVVEERVAHASGVYFPNRAHRLRVALKKLRYTTELLDEDEDGLRGRALRAFKTAQAALGSLHDREVLLRRGADVDRRIGVPRARAFREVLEAECRELFSGYLGVRDEVVAGAKAAAKLADALTESHRGRRALTMGAVALPSATLCLLVYRRYRAA